MGFVERIRRKADHIVVNLVGNILGHAVGDAARALLSRFLAAVDKVLAFSLHDLELFLTHCAADIVSLTETEPGQLAANLHNLFLVDDNAVGNVNDMRHLRRFVGHLGRVLAVAQVGRNGIHRAGAVERNQGDYIFQVLWPHADKHLGHAGRFKLEDALRLTFCQHGVGVRVVVIEVCNTEIRIFGMAHGHLGIMDDGQRAQTQKVHFQKAQPLDFHHVELGDRQAVVRGQRYILGGRVAGNDDARRVGGCMARHPLDFQRGVDEFMHLAVAVVERFQIGADFQRLFQRHFQVGGNELCHPVHILVAHAHNAAHIAHGSAGGHRTKRHDLGHMVTAVFLVDIVNDLLAALVAEVDVEVGH